MAVTATYDSLTRTYALLRVTTARSRGSGPAAPAAEERSSTDSLEVVRAWMTRMEDLRVPPPARPPGDERQMLRITASFGRRMVLGMFPARRSVSVEHPLGP